MTSEEIIEFFAPGQSSVDSVIDWLVASGITKNRISQSANKQASVRRQCTHSTWLSVYLGLFVCALVSESVCILTVLL